MRALVELVFLECLALAVKSIRRKVRSMCASVHVLLPVWAELGEPVLVRHSNCITTMHLQLF